MTTDYIKPVPKPVIKSAPAPVMAPTPAPEPSEEVEVSPKEITHEETLLQAEADKFSDAQIEEMETKVEQESLFLRSAENMEDFIHPDALAMEREEQNTLTVSEDKENIFKKIWNIIKRIGG